MNDRELLQDYVRDRSQDAFAQLVQGHLDLVYSAADRLLRDRHLAEDVTQQVFVLLAQKASRLGRGTILSAWLYRAARNLAYETLRRERRREHREQIAAAEMNQSGSSSSWPAVKPFLDEAMAKLSSADHDAVVLRYFENKSLKEVGEVLGASEDAAQKRVARALDRLRLHLVGRGITVSAAALAADLTSGAVVPAPAGLGLLAASSALATATAPSVLTNLHWLMTAMRTKTIVTAAAFVALSSTVLLLLLENASLRRQMAAMPRPSSTPGTTGTNTIRSASSAQEQQHLRLEHLELLSLRGRVSQLAAELRQAKAAVSPGTGGDPGSGEAPADSILFSAALTNRVPSGNTLVVGGWYQDGMRGYLLATPTVGQQEPTGSVRQVTLDSQVIAAPESFWDQIGWGAAKSETRRSTVAGVLTPAQLDLLLKALKGCDGSEISNSSRASGPDGERMGIGFAMKDEQSDGMLMGIDIYPRIVSDATAVDLGLLPSALSAGTPVHDSIKQAARSGPR